MSKQLPLSILHISDLHFVESGRPEYVDRKDGAPSAVAAEPEEMKQKTTFFRLKIICPVKGLRTHGQKQ